ncbi:MAG: LCP family protein [Candidatus Pacebacteria bacterium]|nr:LCP family protein [Candidatus Paceibacterota bacterium]
MNKKKVLKIFALFFIVIAVFLSAFLYEFMMASGKIFSNGKNDSISIVKQFSEMIINPSESLQGEENGQINILLLGIGGEGHSGGELTDTIMIASIKPQTREAALLSIPRDLYVEVEGEEIKNKINAIKALGDKSKKQNGIELLEGVVEEVSGLKIDYYVQLDFDGFIKIIDLMGGVDVYLENDINDPAYPDFNRGYDPFYIKKGWHHLDGATALKVARSRHSTMGDFDRIKRQQEIIKAFRQKVYEKYSQMDIMTFRDIFISLSDNMETDIELREIPRFYQVLKEIRSNNFTAQTVNTQNYLERIYVGLGYTLGVKDAEIAAEIGKNLFEMQLPEKTAKTIREESATIEIRNGTDSPDLANIIAQDLENMGFRIINSINIDPPDFNGVKIYRTQDCKKAETLSFLLEKFSAQEKISKTLDSRADFVIILGKGF